MKLFMNEKQSSKDHAPILTEVIYKFRDVDLADIMNR